MDGKHKVLGLAALMFGSLLGQPLQAYEQLSPYTIPADKLAEYCIFNDGVYSIGSIFCVKASTAIICKGSPAKWESISPDPACQLMTPLPTPPETKNR
jgi:hypothetical protein